MRSGGKSVAARGARAAAGTPAKAAGAHCPQLPEQSAGGQPGAAWREFGAIAAPCSTFARTGGQWETVLVPSSPRTRQRRQLQTRRWPRRCWGRGPRAKTAAVAVGMALASSACGGRGVGFPPAAAQPENDVPGQGGPQPLLDVMYLRCADEPIDTTPVFNPEISEYRSTLDWKMQFFSVQAQPQGSAVLDNIHLCPQSADCTLQDQQIVKMDFSKNILIEPGSEVLFKFDVLLEGVVRSYTLIVKRLDGTETHIRELIMQGGTLHPLFEPYGTDYRSLLDVEMELARMELHLLDSGQSILVSSEEPIELTEFDNITMLKNDRPGNTRSPPTRLRLRRRRRLREEAYGEFQYPNMYADILVPLGTRRMVHFEVRSADVGHRSYYSLELARPGCPPRQPLFDVAIASCVRFCNTGFWADLRAGRCKLCPDSCLACLGGSRCSTCPATSDSGPLVVDNITGLCVPASRRIWETHPEYSAAAAIAAVSVLIFVCGLCAFRWQGLSGHSRKKSANSDDHRGRISSSSVSTAAGRRKSAPGQAVPGGCSLSQTGKAASNAAAVYSYMPVRMDDSGML